MGIVGVTMWVIGVTNLLFEVAMNLPVWLFNAFHMGGGG